MQAHLLIHTQSEGSQGVHHLRELFFVIDAFHFRGAALVQVMVRVDGLVEQELRSDNGPRTPVERQRVSPPFRDRQQAWRHC